MSDPAIPLVPLLPPLDQADPRRAAAIGTWLGPLLRAGALSPLDVHVVDQVGRMGGETSGRVLLALALAVRAPAHGHICVDLASVRAEELMPEDRSDAFGAEPEGRTSPAEASAPALASDPPDLPFSLPPNRAEWLAAVRASPLVGGREPSLPPTPFVLDGDLLYTRRYWTHQERLASSLRRRMLGSSDPPDQALLERGLAALFPRSDETSSPDRQQLGAAIAALRGLTVISGGPGTGKTFTVRAIICLLWAQWAAAASGRSLRVALAAPTGKAAARMREALLSGLDGFLAGAGGAMPEGRSARDFGDFLVALEPCTIHRLLGWNPGNPTRFRHCAANPLPFDVVIVDEASMIDFALMARLVDAVEKDARLLLLGDRNQLASVEAGTVLADLCGPPRQARLELSRPFARALSAKTGLAVDERIDLRDAEGPWDCMVQLVLNRRFRSDRGIGLFASACLADPFDPSAASEVLASPDGDVSLLPFGGGGKLGTAGEALIRTGYLPYIRRLMAGPAPGEDATTFHRAVLRLFDRFRVLCAHRRGKLGVHGVNDAVVALLEKEGIPGFEPRGEHWAGRPVLVLRNDYVVRRFNGDTGIEVLDGQGGLTVAFPGEGEKVEYLSPSRLPDHQTVFAMTIHKSQGSEFDRVLVILPERESPILTRELIYTAVTRSRAGMSMLGSRELLEQALARTVRRASGLRREIWGAEGLGP